MKEYNGFTAAQRNKAQAWLNVQWRYGGLKRPCQCAACGQTEGRIDAHAEDYSEPLAAGKTDQFHLCFVCHMMVHCRFRSPFAWQRYRRAIMAGVRFAVCRTWPQFKSRFLEDSWPEPEIVSCGRRPERDVFAEILAAGERVTRGPARSA